MHAVNDQRRQVALYLLCLGQLMCILDISIINIAIPSIQKELGLVPSSLQWLITSYVLTYGGLLLVGGRLGDLFGRRRMLLIGLFVFTVASALGGVGVNLQMLLLSRAGQGIGGAIMTPTIMSFIAGLFAEGQERNRALGLLGAVNGAGFALGLVLGGLLTSTVGWRWVFFINVPIGLFVIVGALWVLPQTKRVAHPIDIPGALLAIAALVLVTYTFSTADEFGFFSLYTGARLAVATALLVALAAVQKRSPHPLIPPGVLKYVPLRRALIGSTTFGTVVGPTTFLLTMYLQNVSEFNPLMTGMAFLPQEVMVFLAAHFAGRYIGRFGSRNVLAVGMIALGGASLILTQLSPARGYAAIVLPGLLVAGFGIGVVNVAGSVSATEGVPPSEHGIASGIWNTGTQVGTALGVAVLTAVSSGHTTKLLSDQPSLAPSAAVVGGYKAAFLVAVAFAAVGLISLAALRRGRRHTVTYAVD